MSVTEQKCWHMTVVTLNLKLYTKEKKIIYSYVDFIEIQVSFLTYIFLFSKKDMKPISAER